MNTQIAEQKFKEAYKNFHLEKNMNERSKLKRTYQSIKDFALESEIFSPSKAIGLRNEVIVEITGNIQATVREENPNAATRKNGISYVSLTYDSLLAKSETNDCVVRSFTSAFGVKYDLAHAKVAELFGRKK